MQDLKHLTQKKRSSFSSLFSSNSGNRKKQSYKAKILRFSLPTGKQREKLKYILLFIALVLGLTPVSFYLIKRIPVVTGKISAWSKERAKRANLQPVSKKEVNNVSSFAIANTLLASASDSAENLTATTATGQLLHYSIKSNLQKKVHDFIASKGVPYAVFVAIEPKTGRILAMTSHSSVDPQWASSAFFDLYPMASLFKIITASAALEQKKITPESVIEFRGNSYSENPRYWDINPRGGNNKLNVTYALGKSINPLYGRLACDIAGKGAIMEYVQRFGFNQALLPGIPAKESQAASPNSNQGLMLMGAGLDHEVKISPLHAANIMAAIANNGTMMMPGLTDKIVEQNGAIKDTFTPQELRKLVSPETAHSLTRMLSSTVTSGTSRRAFHDRRGRPLVKVAVAAKTGSINGTDPKGYYSWFAAFAPMEKPEIALVALVINQDKWKIKSSQVGVLALEEFFSK